MCYDDTVGFNCSVYASEAWCDTNGLTGEGWVEEWGAFDEWSHSLADEHCENSKRYSTPSYACCECGGGCVSDLPTCAPGTHIHADVVTVTKESPNVTWRIIEILDDTQDVITEENNFNSHWNYATEICLRSNGSFALQVEGSNSSFNDGSHVSVWITRDNASCALVFEETGKEQSEFVFTVKSSACEESEVPASMQGDSVATIVASNSFYAGSQLADLLQQGVEAINLQTSVLVHSVLPTLIRPLVLTGQCEANGGSYTYVEATDTSSSKCYLDGLSKTSLLRLKNNALTVSNIVLRNAHDLAIDGRNYSVITIEGCLITGTFSASENSSTVFADEHTNVTVIDSLFVSNEHRGALPAATSVWSASTLTMNNVTFYANLGDPLSKWLVLPQLMCAPCCTAWFSRCAWEQDCLVNNTLGVNGGLVHTIKSDITIVFERCTLSCFEVSNNGGIIYVGDEGTNVNITVTDCNIFRNHADQSGGVFYISAYAHVILSNSVIQENGALLGDGGVYYSGWGVDMTVFNSSISYNRVSSTQGLGGWIYAHRSMKLNAAFSRFENNQAYDGGAFYCTHSADTFEIPNHDHDHEEQHEGEETMEEEVVMHYPLMELNNCFLRGNAAANDGGAIFMTLEIDVVMNHCEVSNNSARGNGGALAISYSRMSLTNLIIANNTAVTGGAVRMLSSGLNMTECLLESNAASGMGGGMILVEMDSFFSIRSAFIGNSAITGGALQLEQSLSFLYENILKSNTAEYGAAIDVQGGTVHVPVTLTLYETLVAQNNARTYIGGGLSVTSAHVVITNCSRITQNHAGMFGGGIYAIGNSVAEIDGGSIVDGNMAGYEGGCLYADRSTFKLEEMQLHSCIALGQGGCGYLTQQSRLEGARLTILNCSSEDAGGAFLVSDASEIDLRWTEMSTSTSQAQGGCIAASNSQVSLVETTLANNRAVGGGGALSISHTILTVLECQLLDNTAVLRGGGIRVESGSLVNLSDTMLEGNTAESEGGGLSIVDDNAAALEHRNASETVVTITNCTFANSNGSHGGAVFLQKAEWLGGQTVLERLTLVNNSGVRDGGTHWEHIFWEFTNTSGNPPRCDNCSSTPEFIPILASSAVRFAALQDGNVSLEIPANGTLYANSTNAIPVFSYVALDYYGAVVIPFSSVSVYAQVETDSDLDLSGQTGVQYFSDGGLFTGLLATGMPGTSSSFQLDPLGMSGWETVTVNLHLIECAPGDHLNGLKCETCPAGSLKFSNDSNPCVSCEEYDGIECLGGASYRIDQGWWLSPNAQYCGDVAKRAEGESEEECLLNRVSKCDFIDACTTDGSAEEEAGRSGSGLQGPETIQVCDTERYSSNLPRCGGLLGLSCKHGYRADFVYRACKSCPPLMMVITVSAAVVLSICAMLYFLFMIFRTVDENVKGDSAEGTDDITTMMVRMNQGRCALGIFVGYVQVLGQMTLVFRTSLMPGMMNSMLRVFRPFAIIDTASLFNVPCILYHANLLEPSRTSMFYLGFYDAIITPWLVILFFVIVYRGIKFNIKRKKDSQMNILHNHMAELFDARAACAGCALFIITYMHPSVATRMFQLFSCEDVQFRSRNLSYQPFLRMNAGIRCFSTVWKTAASLDVVTIVFFVFGFPVALFVIMYRMHSFKKVRITCETGNEHRDLMTSGVWKLMNPNDALFFKTHQSFLMPRRRQGSDTGKVPKVDIYMHESSFELSTKEYEKAAQANDVLKKWKRTSKINLFDFVVTLGMRNTMICIKHDSAQTDPVPAAIHEKEDVCFGGLVQNVPVTMLDDAHVAKVMGQFYIPFQDRWYFWQAWDVTRRMLQTGMVVVVELATRSETAALMYALLISFVSILLHQTFQPFKNDAMNSLMLTVLINQFMMQVMIVWMREDESAETGIGIAMILMQMFIMTFTMTLVAPAMRPLFMLVRKKAEVAKTQIRRRMTRHKIKFHKPTSFKSLMSPSTPPSRPDSSEASEEQFESPSSDNGDEEQTKFPPMSRREKEKMDREEGHLPPAVREPNGGGGSRSVQFAEIVNRASSTIGTLSSAPSLEPMVQNPTYEFRGAVVRGTDRADGIMEVNAMSSSSDEICQAPLENDSIDDRVASYRMPAAVIGSLETTGAAANGDSNSAFGRLFSVDSAKGTADGESSVHRNVRATPQELVSVLDVGPRDSILDVGPRDSILDVGPRDAPAATLMTDSAWATDLPLLKTLNINLALRHDECQATGTGQSTTVGSAAQVVGLAGNEIDITIASQGDLWSPYENIVFDDKEDDGSMFHTQ
ncbi:hypothetical protein CYMTET_28533 [Cymbomonas tetramitiformis]|uniref:Uncharacterized protein n=1 Tax=Cymbomonas tetramitiformis TaxID=36881 RepID=A0AAE0FMQ1_9CHLO|nr:hypothetical protein CYMTET_28533 [Cymbomonas tetramitiformis]